MSKYVVHVEAPEGELTEYIRKFEEYKENNAEFIEDYEVSFECHIHIVSGPQKPKTTKEKVAFRKDWDARYERGKKAEENNA